MSCSRSLDAQRGHQRLTAYVQCEDGNGKILVTQKIEYTDFPLGRSETFKMFAERNELGGVTVMLPSEHSVP